MVISESTQLGLKFKHNQTKVEFLKCMERYNQTLLTALETLKTFVEQTESKDEQLVIPKDIIEKEALEYLVGENSQDRREAEKEIAMRMGTTNLVENSDSLFFLITEGVHKPAEVIKMKEGFTGRIFNKIKPGKYTYLMGKNEMVRFVVQNNALKGFWWNDKIQKAFEFGVETDTGRYYFGEGFQKEFTKVMQLITFIELGDIEVVILDAGRHNGKPKNDGKVMNSTNNTVYIVDSSWNKLIIRTEGFAVRGHFKLQPCGPGNADRKLIWVDAFEKHGYTRRPKAEIRNNQ